MTDAPCPACDGVGSYGAFVDGRTRQGRRFGGFRQIACMTCNGKGRIPTHQANWIAEGQDHRKARVERRETIREAAARLNITPEHLSAMEQGRMNPAPLHKDDGHD